MFLYKKKIRLSTEVHKLKSALRKHKLHTVCEEARCPNMGECFEKGTATFMIMGNVCTRSCGFCAVATGEPLPLDSDEPSRVAKEVLELGLKHVVVTSVTRDDLPDGGASHFAKTIQEIRKMVHFCHREETDLPTMQAQARQAGGRRGDPVKSVSICAGLPRPFGARNDDRCTIEVLTPDFGGNTELVQIVLDARPDVFNHNIETVKRLTGKVRNKAEYERSLSVLRFASRRHCEERSDVAIPCNPMLVKSGFMVGLGETDDEVIAAIRDLKNSGCDVITIGQYLQPLKTSLPVVRYVEPNKFEEYKKIGEKLGAKYMFCGPFVRSSYFTTRR